MLSEGTEGSSLKQIDSVIGKYQPTKYTNSKNVSFANGFIIRDSFKNAVLSSYADILLINIMQKLFSIHLLVLLALINGLVIEHLI